MHFLKNMVPLFRRKGGALQAAFLSAGVWASSGLMLDFAINSHSFPGVSKIFWSWSREVFYQDLIWEEGGSCQDLHGKGQGFRDKTITMGETFSDGGGENDCWLRMFFEAELSSVSVRYWSSKELEICRKVEQEIHRNMQSSVQKTAGVERQKWAGTAIKNWLTQNRGPRFIGRLPAGFGRLSQQKQRRTGEFLSGSEREKLKKDGRLQQW